MVRQESVAEVLAIVVATADVAFVVAMAAVVNKHFGVWEAAAVAAMLTVINGVVLLFSIGIMSDMKQQAAGGQ